MGFGIEPVENAAPAVSDIDKAAAAAAPATAVGSPDDRFVLYTVPRRASAKVVSRPSGESGDGTYASEVGDEVAVAEISVQDWARVGVAATRAVVWNAANQWRVPEGHFTGEQLDYLLNNSKRFELVDRRGNKVTR